jgi:solute carrier family 25 carnitine/acylcarnitine transporter 20/29
LLTVSAIRATSFSIYEGTKQHMREFGWQTDKIWSLGAGSFLAGGASGLAIAALSCPFELVKIHRQLQVLFWQRQDKELRRTIMDANTTPEARRLAEQARQRLVDPRTLPTWASVREIVQLRGPLGLFYGLRSHLMRDLAGTGTYFAGYECLKRTLASLESGEHPSAGVHFLAGGLAGVFCWILTFPLDLVKSIIQKDVTSVTSIEANGVTTVHPKLARAPSGWRVARDIWRRAGVRGLYNGISVTLIRAFPIHALNFTVYEYVTNRIQELTRE